MKKSLVIAVVVMVVLIVVGGAFLLTPKPITREITLQAFDFCFLEAGVAGQNPTITVNSGDTIVLTIHNLGGKDHEFFVLTQSAYNTYINALQAGQAAEEPEPAFEGAEIEDIEPGNTRTGTFVAGQAGTYVYACLDKDGTAPLTHAHKGMFGTFLVKSVGLLGLIDWLSDIPSFLALPAPVIGTVMFIGASIRRNTP